MSEPQAEYRKELRAMTPHGAEDDGMELAEEAIGSQILHVYAQELWHDEAYIVGTPGALEALRDCIDRALSQSPRSQKMEAMTNDGEGYDLYVLCSEGTEIDRMQTPYAAEIARGGEEPGMGFGPWTVIIEEKKKNFKADAISRQAENNP